MTTRTAIEKERKSLRKKIDALEAKIKPLAKRLGSLAKRRSAQCIGFLPGSNEDGCDKWFPIKSLKAVQGYHWDGCEDWRIDDEWYFNCPACGAKNRIMQYDKNSKDYLKPWVRNDVYAMQYDFGEREDEYGRQ